MKPAVAVLLVLAAVAAAPWAVKGEDCMTVTDFILLDGNYTFITQVMQLLPNWTDSVLSNPDAEVTLWVPNDAAVHATLALTTINPNQLLVPEQAPVLQQIVDAHMNPVVYTDLDSVDGQALPTLDTTTSLMVDWGAGTVGTANPVLPVTSTIMDIDGIEACKSMVYPITSYLIISTKVMELVLTGV